MNNTFSIQLESCQKKFGQQVLFSNLNYSFEKPESYALLGPNGTGKSTLLGILYGYISPSLGKISWRINQTNIDREEAYQYCSFTSPFMELPEELTAGEIWDFHFSLRKLISPIEKIEALQLYNLDKALDKPIKHFSSGMKSRLKLLLAVFSQSEVLLLDEPCTNMDADGIKIYHLLLDQFLNERLLIVASNLPEEYDRCANKLILDRI